MTAGEVRRTLGTGHGGDRQAPDLRLRRMAVVFLAAVVVHGADHARRGVDVVTAQVTWAGTIQFLLAVTAVVLVFRGHPWAPTVAAAIGFASAAGFIAAHLLPYWGSFSDPFTGSAVAPEVSTLSWLTALFEIGADIAFGWAGVRALATYGRRNSVARTSS
jgi:hypothetical protein